MSTKRIKGIIIQLNGDTAPLTKSLQNVNKVISTTQTELRDINKLLKLNPSSSELLKQKQQALSTEIDATKKKLEEEQKALAELESNADGTEENTRQQNALKREIIDTTNKLKVLEKQARQSSSILGEKMKVAGDKIKSTGDKITTLGTSLSKISAGFAAVGGAALKVANDYEDGLNKVNTIAGLTGKEFRALGDDLLKVSSDTGKSATEITEAAYQALSASVPTDEVSDFVNKAAKLSKAGFTETSTAVDVLTTAINAYGLKTSEAEALANKLVQVQNDGKTTVDQLASSMGNVIPTAAALGVSFDQISAMYVLMTKQGINTKVATTSIRATLNELSKAGSDVADKFKLLTGQSFGQFIKSGHDVSDALQILYDSVEGDSEAFKNLFGNVRAGQGALAIMNQGSDAFKESLDKIGDSAGNVDAAIETMRTPLKDAKKALNDTKNSAITLGQSGLEALAPTISNASSKLSELNKWFQSLDDKQKSATVKFIAIGAAVGPATVAVGTFVKGVGNVVSGIGSAVKGISAFLVKIGLKTAATTADAAATAADTAAETASTVASTANATAQGASAAATAAAGTAATGAAVGFSALNLSMIVVVAAIAAIVAIGVLLYKNWDKIKATAEKLGNTIKEKWDGIRKKTAETFSKVKDTMSNAMGAAHSYVSGKLNNIETAYQKNGGGVKGIVAATMTGIKEYYKTGFDAVNAITGGRLGKLTSTVSGKMSEVKSKIKAKFVEIKENAIQWGKDLISNFVSGITKSLYKITDAMKKIGQKIKDLIGFSEPKDGPLSNFHTFAPDMVDLFVEGINKSLPKLEHAMNNMAAVTAAGSSSIVNNNRNVTVNQYNSYSAPHSHYEMWQSKNDLTRTIQNTVRGAV